VTTAAARGVIRRAALDDIAELMRIRLSVLENRFNPARVSPADVVWFVENAPVWVWEEDGAIRGFSAGDPRNGSIWALFVEPGFDGRGIGGALLARACASLAEAGHATATLDTEPGTRAAEFYRRRGWTEQGLDSAGELLFSRAL
jgi:GNAT superfamily N-acetyltransferase